MDRVINHFHYRNFEPFLLRKIAAVVALLVLCFGLSASLWGQKDTGSIVGTVRDATGAVIPRAKVTVSDLDKGTAFVTSTGSSGDYVASPLRVGRYSVTV